MFEVIRGVLIGTLIGITVGIILVSFFEGESRIFYLYVSLYFIPTPINSIRVRRGLRLLFYRIYTFNFDGDIMKSIIRGKFLINEKN